MKRILICLLRRCTVSSLLQKGPKTASVETLEVLNELATWQHSVKQRKETAEEKKKKKGLALKISS